MNCYVEGSDKGKLRFCDVENHGELMFVLPSDFSERISCLHYCKEKNVLFAGAKDGKFRVWKIPNEWRDKQMDMIEKEVELVSKQSLNVKSSK
jgi:WD40 repeat protein